MEDMVTVSVQDLTKQCVKHFMKVGLTEKDATTSTDILVHANLRGVDSHGTSRMPYYEGIITDGIITNNPQITIKETGPASAIIDGNNGLGLVIAHKATEKAIEMAKRNGVGMVGAFNSCHCGSLSYYVKMAAEHDLIGMATTNAGPGVIAFGGKKPFFGTNPIAFGFPAGKNPPVILDMATSTVAMGRITHDYLLRGQPIPLGWAVDDDGNDTTDPSLAKWMLHFGGAKGFGLAMVADIFAGILTGGSFSHHLRLYFGDDDSSKSNLGVYVCAFDPNMFTDINRFKDQMDLMIDEIHDVPPAEGFNRVMVPGEPERLKEEHRSVAGIPLTREIYEFLFDD